MLYLDYDIKRKRKGKPQEIEARKATGLRSRVNFFHYSSICVESERTVSRAAETVTGKRTMKSYGFFIESIPSTLKKYLKSRCNLLVGGQSIIEYSLVFVAFVLAVIFVFGLQGQRARTVFENARNAAVDEIKR
jgi:hypothetical protein